jgi:hypothetical protein
LLSSDEKAKVRKQLTAQHCFFYHGTPTMNLESIAAHGLDPDFESEDSRYPDRKYEPHRAMRFATLQGIQAAISAANARSAFQSIQGSSGGTSFGGIVLLRVQADTLLDRSFGLDHSHAVVADIVAEHLSAAKTQLSALDFLQIIDSVGVISCYERIAPDLIEVSEDFTGVGAFATLIEYTKMFGRS